MVVIVLILLSLGAAVFIMLTDTRKNDTFGALERAAARAEAARKPPEAAADPAESGTSD